MSRSVAVGTAQTFCRTEQETHLLFRVSLFVCPPCGGLALYVMWEGSFGDQSMVSIADMQR